jgi:hypothetical protein
MRPLESRVEGALVRALKRRGLVTLKLNLQGNRGWPDRLALVPPGRAIFVELKRPGGKPRPLQEYVHAQIKKLGFEVVVIDNAVVAVAWAEQVGRPWSDLGAK